MYAKVFPILRNTVLQAIPTILGIAMLNFLLLELAPGDAADYLAAESGSATAESIAELRERFALDRPVVERLGAYLFRVATFDLGYSPRHSVPVLDLIVERLPNTLLLMASALSIALVVGIAAGVVMASFADRFADRVISIVVMLFYSVPGFWVSLMAIILFSVHLGILPSGGSQTVAAGFTGPEAVLDRLRHLVLPACSMSLFFIAIYARLTRASMLEVQSQDFIRTARAKGLGPVAVALRHVLRNALMPVITLAGMHFGTLLGGAIVIETVFSWPGLGRLVFESVVSRDFSVLLGVLLLSSLLVIIANAVVDILQVLLDPRVGAS